MGLDLERDEPIDVTACVAEARVRLFGQRERDPISGQFVAARSSAPALGPGDRSVQLRTALAPLRGEIQSRLLRDQGVNAADAPETLLMATRDLASLDTIGESLWLYVLERGPLTSKGKSTAAVAKLLAVLDRKAKLYGVLGLERKSKPVPSLRDYMARPAATENS